MNKLPDVILENIFQWMRLKDLLICTGVCFRWKQIIDQEIVWKRILYKHFDVKPSEERFQSSIVRYWKSSWFPGGNNRGNEICYIFHSSPFVLGCGVVAPHGFQVDNSHKNLVIALEKLKILSFR